ncbi:MAG: nucleotidyltransferase domain-containing protein [Candidatus Pacearchaeota archaeon]
MVGKSSEKNNKEQEKEVGSIEKEIKQGPEIKYEARPKKFSEEEIKKEIEKTKEKLDKFKTKLLEKYNFIIGIGILPPQAIVKFEEEDNIFESIPDEKERKKLIHVLILTPEEQFKNFNKIKPEIIKLAKEADPNIWIHLKTPVDVWNYGLDSKYDYLSAIAMSFPIFDKGFLGSLRVAEIHKNLVLQKFEKYVVSYVIAGSLVRGEATKTSDVDVFVIIDDTDVKRMHRLELKEKLRNIIYNYVLDASELAGVKNKLSPQIYILTEFWESVKDANPVIFTFIRDGVPMYDRGTFMPWKSLLKMGKLKPSPEAIEMFMSMGDKTTDTINRRLIDAMIDIYWGAVTPSQALLMLYGLPPPTGKSEIVEVMEEIFVKKEKMLEPKYIKILEKIVKLWRDYEHEKFNEISGKEIDELTKEFKDYTKRLKELKEQIEKRSNQKTIEQFYKDIINLLQGAFGKKSEEELIRDFENEMVKKGKLPEFYLRILKDVFDAREKFKKGKMMKHEIEEARKNANLLINQLIEYNQRCELLYLDQNKFKIKTKEGTYTLIVLPNEAFILKEKEILKVMIKEGQIVKSDAKEMAEATAKVAKQEISVSGKLFEILKKEFGEFELVL